LEATGHGSVKLFDAVTLAAAPVFAFDGHAGNVTALGFNVDGSWVYTGGEDETVKTWDIRFVFVVGVLLFLVFLWVFVGGFFSTGNLTRWCDRMQRASAEHQREFNHQSPVTCATLHPNQVCLRCVCVWFVSFFRK
jgi:WD40 repeat protein